jgi:hypothetical protein
VVADRSEALRKSCEDPFTSVVDGAEVAVFRLWGTEYFGASGKSDPLVTETDPKNRKFCLMEEVP